MQTIRSGDRVEIRQTMQGTVAARQYPWSVDAHGGAGLALEAFDGPYEVVPSPNEQTLPTARRRMTDDVTVNAIPYLSVSNPAGGRTITIGDVYHG